MKSVLFLITGFLLSKSFALSVNPGNLDLTPANGKSTGVFVVTNDGKKELNVSVQLKTKTITEDGTEKRGDINPKDILVFPKTIKIPPNSTGAVRVVYTGSKDIDLEKNFRIIFTEERPEKLNPKKNKSTSATVRFVMAYACSINALPKNGKKESIRFEGLVDQEGKKFLKFRNDGDFRAFFDGSVLLFKDKKGKATAIKTDSVEALKSPMQAKTTRKVPLPDLKDLDLKSVEVKFEEAQ